MEGNWRVASWVGVVLACCAIGVTAGCGSDSSGSSADGIETRNPEATFAPLVRLDPDERWPPMAADTFLDNSIFGFAEDQGCADRPIAVGHDLEELWTPVIDWLGVAGLGNGAGTDGYFRTPFAPASPKHDPVTSGTPCPFREGYRYFANQQTRPHEKKDRVEGLRLTEGYYLDLVNRARAGVEPPLGSDEKSDRIAAPAYVERREQDVDGEPGLRLSYWLLYGMNQPLDPQGDAIDARTHEGDWERVDVLLQAGDGDDEWTPVAVRLLGADGSHRDVPWASVKRTAAGASHPVLTAVRGDHALSPAPRRGDDCAACPQWSTWTDLAPARKQPWYGFGGAWGEPGTSSPTTGPLGPHDKWLPDSPFNEDT